MSSITKLLIVAHRSIESEVVRDAIIERAAAGPVHVTLVTPAAVGAGPMCAPRTESGQRLAQALYIESVERVESAVQQLRDAGVAVDGIASADLEAGVVQEEWNPTLFDEVVVSCRPWLAFRTDVAEPLL